MTVAGISAATNDIHSKESFYVRASACRLMPSALMTLRIVSDTVLVSAVSAWEMTVKMSLGKLRFDGGIADAVEACGFERLDMRFEHAEAVRSLPSHHSDPFDRLLIAQAIVEGATFVTHDRAIANYLIPTLWI